MAELDYSPAAVTNHGSYDCRGRNNDAGAKISEHGRGNALDLGPIRLANGAVMDLTKKSTPQSVRRRLRDAACHRFNTVLGPGSDSYHVNHIHVDLAERTHGYRMCQWDVREPETVAEVPIPLPKPRVLRSRSTSCPSASPNWRCARGSVRNRSTDR
jgi:Extensin-like protein C-terminus